MKYPEKIHKIIKGINKLNEKDTELIINLIESYKENNKRFLVVFRGEQIDTKNHYRSKVVFISHFESEKVLDESNLTDKFLLINAPAIGYPYFRAFYSNFLLNAGYEPIILPTINFVKLADDKAKALSEKKTDSD